MDSYKFPLTHSPWRMARWLISYGIMLCPAFSKANASREMLVTAEGDMVHNLWQDIFYIPNPTMAFVGTPLQVTTFYLFDFQAQVVARVFAGKAYLPAQDVMRKEYEDRLAYRGTGWDFYSLRKRGAEQDYVARLVEWMNKDAAVTGTEYMRGHT
ncbi:hypothetical protein Z517_09360 [Fonsecaea pedrosoi CBS 271.37]|uniref:Uncharacterized protein n=1 Tax=Fonsecaea pedrosoi CBS 271.37 TaxID=1442368 RepID=A0A0D2DGV8_9EURO|nr:uncharacterized protein Z517_09360 [Fonsecaea pedrosoi CBS 271.37]KIW76916.1 hypothetical protein Z517_09360 [Fonsecaea pedrosoi CBS 271.37]